MTPTTTPPPAELEAHKAAAITGMLASPEFKGIDRATMEKLWPAIATAARVLASSYQKSPPVRPMVVGPGLIETPALVP